MVLLAVTPIVKDAVEQFNKTCQLSNDDTTNEIKTDLGELVQLELGDPIEHSKLVEISRVLVKRARKGDEQSLSREWRLDTLLKGTSIYQLPPLPKQEPVSAYQHQPHQD